MLFMNKPEFIAAVSEKTGLSRKDTERTVNAALDTISAALVEGERVQFSGFGIFETKLRKAASVGTPTPSCLCRLKRPKYPPSSPARC